MKNMTLESAQESYKFGFAITYDGDKHKVLIGTNCNHCEQYFEGEVINIYCPEC